MLKFTYTETGLHLEHLTQSLEEWMVLRVILAMRTGQRLLVERYSASFLLPADLAELHALETVVRREDVGAIALSTCDTEYVEVCLQGTWVSSNPDAVEGVFVVAVSHHTEFLIFKLWQASQSCTSLRR